MKINHEENEHLSNAIDEVQEGINTIIELYNESEIEQHVIEFENDVIEGIEKAKEAFGEDFVNKKINTFIKEVITFLPLNDYNAKNSIEETTEQKNIQ